MEQTHAKKNETGPPSYTIYKKELKLIKDLNVKAQNHKTRENIGSKLFPIGPSNIFFFLIYHLRQGKEKKN